MRTSQHIHFIGIGGSGMSGIAEVLLNLGYRVSGSDLKASEATRRLQRLGARIYYGHEARHLSDATDVVVVSNAVPDTNPEIAAARGREIPVIPRAQMLNDLMRLKQGIAIAGTHGKTTTTSMVAWVLTQAGLDPTMVIGGVLNNLRRGARRGTGEYFVVEACEAYSSFLHLSPVAVAVTNIDDDHLENYGSRAALDDAFVAFINRVPFWGFAAVNQDDPGLRAILPRLVPRLSTYGFEPGADLRAVSPVLGEWTSEALVLRRGQPLGRLRLNLPGRHNLSNALAAAAVCLELGVSFPAIQKALGKFTGVQRRFERKGTYGQAVIVDDYAHHPTEIAATLAAARAMKPGRVVALFQPHLFSRTQRLYREFARALTLADVVFLADIYPARERAMPGVTSQLLFDQLSLEGHPAAARPASLADLLPLIKRELRPGDLFLTIGAGDVTRVSDLLAAAGARSRRRVRRKA